MGISETKKTESFQEKENLNLKKKIIELRTKVKDLKPKIEESFVRLEAYQSTSTKIFLTSCMFAVILDPLFFYIPFIDEDQKRLRMDKKMMIIVLLFRCFTDIFFLLHILFQLSILLIRMFNKNVFTSSTSGWKSIIIGIWAILPLPQVLILVLYYNMWCVSWTTLTFLNYFVLSQYAPRILRIYHSCMELKQSYDSITGHVWVKGAFNFFLYVIAGHIFGAFWYYFSIQRMTECWKIACKSYVYGCDFGDLNCQYVTNSPNLTFIGDSCPVNPPNTTIFDFGIFMGALESGIVGTTNFPEKYMQCFWWGLQNLSSLGQNLQTSVNFWETCFAALISIIGLLLFLYLIGNLQTYMQLETKASHKRRKELMKNIKDYEIDLWVEYINNRTKVSYNKKHLKNLIVREQRQALKREEDFDLSNLLAYLTARISERELKDEDESGGVSSPPLMKKPIKEAGELEIYISDWKRLLESKREGRAESWISANEIPENIKDLVNKYLLKGLKDEHIDVEKVLSILPTELGTHVKAHLCLPTLQKLIAEESDGLELPGGRDHAFVETICHLTPVVYKEDTYIISAGEPLDFMLFITQGVAWSFGGTKTDVFCLERNSYFGEELLHWMFGKGQDTFPISKKFLKSHTKIEGFLLKIMDLHKIFMPDDLCKNKSLQDSTRSSKLDSCLESFVRSAAKRALKVPQERKEDSGQAHEGGGDADFV